MLGLFLRFWNVGLDYGPEKSCLNFRGDLEHILDIVSCLQCFDAVGWVTGRASGL